MKLSLAFAAILVLTPALQAQQLDPCPQDSSHISLTAGTFSLMPGVDFHLRNFVATLVSRGKTAPACYLKTTELSRGQIAIDNASLTRLFAGKLDGKSNIQDLRIENQPGKVLLTGKIVKLIPINFSMEGTVTTNGSDLILNVQKVKADGIPVRSLLGLIGEHLNSVIGLHGVAGIQVTDNTMTFSPEQIAHLHGHLASVQCTASGVILTYTPGRAAGRRKR